MISEEKISGFTDPVSLKRIRAEFAAVLNRECRREGLDGRFTHQNYKERGTRQGSSATKPNPRSVL